MGLLRNCCVLKSRLTTHFKVGFSLCGVILLIAAITPVSLHAQTYTDLHEFICATDGCRGDLPGIPAQARDGKITVTIGGGSASSSAIFTVN
jgi:hypothetical protein